MERPGGLREMWKSLVQDCFFEAQDRHATYTSSRTNGLSGGSSHLSCQGREKGDAGKMHRPLAEASSGGYVRRKITSRSQEMSRPSGQPEANPG